MAIDTRPKRESSLGMLAPWIQTMPVPDGGGAATEGERQNMAHSYNGIDAGTPPGQAEFTQVVFNSRVFDSRVITGGIVGW